jgi:GntR family transcriptional regulator, transcriptional repressor for pyruvate dehydrogenase complex
LKVGVKIKEQTSVVQEIFLYVKNALIRGELQPGQKLPIENQLAQNFGVSRTAVREAFKMLAAIGVAEIKQGNGTYIAKEISSSAIDPMIFGLIMGGRTPHELLEVRKMIEVGIMEILLDKITEEDIVNMENAILDFEQNYDKANPNWDELTDLDLRFHYAFADATHNKSISKIARIIWDLFAHSIQKSVRVENANAHHKRILQAIKARDRDKAREAIRISLDIWEKHQE